MSAESAGAGLVRPLSLPVVLGTSRRGRASAAVATFVRDELARRDGVTTDLIDIGQLAIPTDDAGEPARPAGFGEAMERADGLVLVVPEYNHGYPGLLKHVLDTCLKEYIHKPVGVCGVSAGGFGGTRVIENLLPVLRELGLVTIFWDGNFSNAASLFDENGVPGDGPALSGRMVRYFDELIWMATVLRYGRENVPLP